VNAWCTPFQYFQVGGNTNGGVPGGLSGSKKLKESLLSGATLVANLADPLFDGYLTYNAPDNGNLASGHGVEVFAPGNRSPFDLVLHSNGNLYGSDNGPNLSYGGMSASCTGKVPDLPDLFEKDKLNLLVRGKYYGHPNRKRGETDPRECVWHSAYAPSDENYQSPIVMLESSSDGIIEWQSNHFLGALRGNLILSQYKGALFRVVLTPNGTAVIPESNPPSILHADGGLDVTQGPNGNLYTARYILPQVRVLSPSEPNSTELAIKSVYPRRGGVAGGNLLYIYGKNLTAVGSPTVTVGGAKCKLSSVTAEKIACSLPGGSGTVDVVVKSGTSVSIFSKGYRYITGMPQT
jgi:IPT/TIG domain/Glucose / Sorbosone dehydrogenase